MATSKKDIKAAHKKMMKQGDKANGKGAKFKKALKKYDETCEKWANRK